jgi:hypothetical protein
VNGLVKSKDPHRSVKLLHIMIYCMGLMIILNPIFQSTNQGGSTVPWSYYLHILFRDFGSLAMVFLTHFQLPIRYEMGTDLLTSLRQNTTMHISNHIHEWRRQRRLVKAQIPDGLLADWFTKSLLP